VSRSIFAAVAVDGSGVWAIGDTAEEARAGARPNSAKTSWYAPGDPEYLAVIADDPDVLRAAVVAAKRNAAKRRTGADVDPEREDLLRSAVKWDRAAARLQALLDKVNP